MTRFEQLELAVFRARDRCQGTESWRALDELAKEIGRLNRDWQEHRLSHD